MKRIYYAKEVFCIFKETTNRWTVSNKRSTRRPLTRSDSSERFVTFFRRAVSQWSDGKHWLLLSQNAEEAEHIETELSEEVGQGQTISCPLIRWTDQMVMCDGVCHTFAGHLTLAVVTVENRWVLEITLKKTSVNKTEEKTEKRYRAASNPVIDDKDR